MTTSPTNQHEKHPELSHPQRRQTYKTGEEEKRPRRRRGKSGEPTPGVRVDEKGRERRQGGLGGDLLTWYEKGACQRIAPSGCMCGADGDGGGRVRGGWVLCLRVGAGAAEEGEEGSEGSLERKLRESAEEQGGGWVDGVCCDGCAAAGDDVQRWRGDEKKRRGRDAPEGAQRRSGAGTCRCDKCRRREREGRGGEGEGGLERKGLVLQLHYDASQPLPTPVLDCEPVSLAGLLRPLSLFSSTPVTTLHTIHVLAPPKTPRPQQLRARVLTCRHTDAHTNTPDSHNARPQISADAAVTAARDCGAEQAR